MANWTPITYGDRTYRSRFELVRQRLDEIIELKQAGVGAAEIAARYGITVPTLYRAIRRLPDSKAREFIRTPPIRKTGLVIDGIDPAETRGVPGCRLAAALLTLGFSVQEIAERLGRSLRWTYSLLEQARHSGILPPENDNNRYRHLRESPCRALAIAALRGLPVAKFEGHVDTLPEAAIMRMVDDETPRQ